MPIQSVTEINQSIKLLLENGFSFISVKGEISNLKKPFSGHLYFSLKDEKSQLKSVLFKMQQRYLPQGLEDGKEVICHGRISVYEPRGEYQLIVDSVDFHGAGALQLSFEKLKQKLAGEGLFDRQHKKPLPFLPEKIALVTSPQGAAIHDFLKVAGLRCPSVPIDIYPVRVQGDFAAAEIVAAIQLINKTNDSEVIVLCRGGGSLEDLWPFNDEALARAIYASRIPIISAIGHEIDFTIADFTADFRAATPTAAVEAALPEAAILREKLNKCQMQMARALKNKIFQLHEKITSLKRILARPIDRINRGKMRIDYSLVKCANALNTSLRDKRYQLLKTEDRFFGLNPQRLIDRQRQQTYTLADRLRSAMLHLLEAKRVKLDNQEGILKAVSPLSVLDRGYAIVQSATKKIIRSTEQVSVGDILNVRLADGKLRTRVLSDK